MATDVGLSMAASKLAQRKRKQAYALQSVGWCYAGRFSGVWQLAATFTRGACSPAKGRPPSANSTEYSPTHASQKPRASSLSKSVSKLMLSKASP